MEFACGGICARAELGVLPSPLWGGVGGGGHCARRCRGIIARPPSPPLPRKGGGSRPSVRPDAGSRPRASPEQQSRWQQQHEGGEEEHVGGGVGKAARSPLDV